MKTKILVALIAGGLTMATPVEAQAAKKCNFSKNEKIAMVSWIFPIAGAVMTGLACKRDLF